MRWSLRASHLPVVFDALLEGSLVGVPYLALASGGSDASAPLSLAVFWLASGVGLLAARWRPRRFTRVDWVRATALAAGLAGWLADPAARDVLVAMKDPLSAVPIHPAGWLLAIAVLRGAVHAKPEAESESAAQAITFAFPVLAASLLLHLGGGGTFLASALVGSVVCVAAGLLAIGYARMRELDSLGSVNGGMGTWRTVAVVVMVVAALAIPLSIVVGTSARDLVSQAIGLAREAVAAILGLAADFLGWLQSVIAQLLGGAGGPQPLPTASPSPSPSASAGPSAAPESFRGFHLPSMAWLDALVRIGIVVLLVLIVIRFRRLMPSRRMEAPVADPTEERRREPGRPGISLRLPRPGILRRLTRRRNPTSAAQAYVALLDELAEHGELGRRPDETPRDHAERAGELGLERLPLGLLAADYELAIYGRKTISEHETERALGRRRRLRKLARRLPRD